jgi:MFS transporter, ACS family, hexuronate transporter
MKQGDVGPYLAIPPLLFDAGAVFFGHLASVRMRKRERGAPDRPLFALAALLGVSIALTPFGKTPLQSMLLGGLGMAGGGGVFALLTADMLSRVPASVVGSASSVGTVAQSIALIVTSPLLGMLIKASGGYLMPFVAVGALIVPGCVAWLLWKPPPVVGGEVSEPG